MDQRPSLPPPAQENRTDRAKKALGFTKRGYKFVVGKKTAFSGDGNMIFTWSERCYHEAWVAVHGPESICLVTWSQDLDVSRLLPAFRNNCTAERAMCSFGETVISDVECIPYDDAEDHDLHHFGRGVKLPFAVASVPRRCVREGPSFKYDFDKVKKFLKEKTKSGLSSSIDETILTAVSGFQHLCPKELNAEDIWVTVLTPCVGEMMHLHLEKRREYLAVMKGGGSPAGVGVSSELAPPILSSSPPVWVYKTDLPEPDLMKEFGMDTLLAALPRRPWRKPHA